jgi:hypothetical protein
MDAPIYYVAVGNSDGPAVNGEPLYGPIVFEQYLNDCTLENAKARLACKAMEECGGGRLARLDFDLQGDPSEPHVVVAGHDGVNKDRGPLVWETYVEPGKHTRDVANLHAARIERRYGACRVARLVFEDVDGRPL